MVIRVSLFTIKMRWISVVLISMAYCMNMYIVPHSHCDTGWLESFEAYYLSHVKFIITNVMNIMKEDPSYKFVWAETSFLRRWMRDQTDQDKQRMRELIKSGRIEIVGGGFSQNDEALSDIEAVIRNLETGHAYLKEEFDINSVKVAWQIDPFGHSAITPSIFSKFGYEYMVGSRIDINLKVKCI